jgi:hypothetical protein
MSISDYYLLVPFASFVTNQSIKQTSEDPHTGHFLSVVLTNLSDEVSSNTWLHFKHLYVLFIIDTP